MLYRAAIYRESIVIRNLLSRHGWGRDTQWYLFWCAQCERKPHRVEKSNWTKLPNVFQRSLSKFQPFCLVPHQLNNRPPDNDGSATRTLISRAFSWIVRNMEILTLCEGNSPITGGFPSQRPVTRSFDIYFDLRLNKRLRKQSRRRWFETPSRSLWRHYIGMFCW